MMVESISISSKRKERRTSSSATTGYHRSFGHLDLDMTVHSLDSYGGPGSPSCSQNTTGLTLRGIKESVQADILLDKQAKVADQVVQEHSQLDTSVSSSFDSTAAEAATRASRVPGSARAEQQQRRLAARQNSQRSVTSSHSADSQRRRRPRRPRSPTTSVRSQRSERKMATSLSHLSYTSKKSPKPRRRSLAVAPATTGELNMSSRSTSSFQLIAASCGSMSLNATGSATTPRQRRKMSITNKPNQSTPAVSAAGMPTTTTMAKIKASSHYPLRRATRKMTTTTTDPSSIPAPQTPTAIKAKCSLLFQQDVIDKSPSRHTYTITNKDPTYKVEIVDKKLKYKAMLVSSKKEKKKNKKERKETESLPNSNKIGTIITSATLGYSPAARIQKREPKIVIPPPQQPGTKMEETKRLADARTEDGNSHNWLLLEEESSASSSSCGSGSNSQHQYKGNGDRPIHLPMVYLPIDHLQNDNDDNQDAKLEMNASFATIDTLPRTNVNVDDSNDMDDSSLSLLCVEDEDEARVESDKSAELNLDFVFVNKIDQAPPINWVSMSLPKYDIADGRGGSSVPTAGEIHKIGISVAEAAERETDNFFAAGMDSMAVAAAVARQKGSVVENDSKVESSRTLVDAVKNISLDANADSGENGTANVAKEPASSVVAEELTAATDSEEELFNRNPIGGRAKEVPGISTLYKDAERSNQIGAMKDSKELSDSMHSIDLVEHNAAAIALRKRIGEVLVVDMGCAAKAVPAREVDGTTHTPSPSDVASACAANYTSVMESNVADDSVGPGGKRSSCAVLGYLPSRDTQESSSLCGLKPGVNNVGPEELRFDAVSDTNINSIVTHETESIQPEALPATDGDGVVAQGPCPTDLLAGEYVRIGFLARASGAPLKDADLHDSEIVIAMTDAVADEAPQLGTMGDISCPSANELLFSASVAASRTKTTARQTDAIRTDELKTTNNFSSLTHASDVVQAAATSCFQTTRLHTEVVTFNATTQEMDEVALKQLSSLSDEFALLPKAALSDLPSLTKTADALESDDAFPVGNIDSPSTYVISSKAAENGTEAVPARVEVDPLISLQTQTTPPSDPTLISSGERLSRGRIIHDSRSEARRKTTDALSTGRRSPGRSSRGTRSLNDTSSRGNVSVRGRRTVEDGSKRGIRTIASDTADRNRLSSGRTTDDSSIGRRSHDRSLRDRRAALDDGITCSKSPVDRSCRERRTRDDMSSRRNSRSTNGLSPRGIRTLDHRSSSDGRSSDDSLRGRRIVEEKSKRGSISTDVSSRGRRSTDYGRSPDATPPRGTRSVDATSQEDKGTTDIVSQDVRRLTHITSDISSRITSSITLEDMSSSRVCTGERASMGGNPLQRETIIAASKGRRSMDVSASCHIPIDEGSSMGRRSTDKGSYRGRRSSDDASSRGIRCYDEESIGRQTDDYKSSNRGRSTDDASTRGCRAIEVASSGANRKTHDLSSRGKRSDSVPRPETEEEKMLGEKAKKWAKARRAKFGSQPKEPSARKVSKPNDGVGNKGPKKKNAAALAAGSSFLLEVAAAMNAKPSRKLKKGKVESEARASSKTKTMKRGSSAAKTKTTDPAKPTVDIPSPSFDANPPGRERSKTPEQKPLLRAAVTDEADDGGETMQSSAQRRANLRASKGRPSARRPLPNKDPIATITRTAPAVSTTMPVTE